MKKVKETCICGCYFEIEDSEGSLISKDGAADEKGDFYIWQRELRKFRKIHKKCLKQKKLLS